MMSIPETATLAKPVSIARVCDRACRWLSERVSRAQVTAST